MEHPILFISIILEMLGLPVPHGPIGDTLLAKLVSPHLTYTWLVMAFLIIVPKLTLGKMEMIPGKGQNFWELIIDGLEGFMAENMGEEGARLMFPMLATFAFYILTSNLIGLMPGLSCIVPRAICATCSSTRLFFTDSDAVFPQVKGP